MKIKSLTSVFILSSFTTTLAQAGQLSLAEYLEQVKTGNTTLVASKIQQEAGTIKDYEHKLVYQPVIFAQVQSAEDKKEPNNRLAQGDNIRYDMATAGFQQQFATGTKSKLAYTLSHTNILGAGAAYLPKPNYYEGQWSLEVSQSLWRNLGGKETNAVRDMLDASAKAQKYGESFKQKAILSKAENVYYLVAQLKKIVDVQADALERARKLKNWTKSRYDRQLGDKSDYLQAEANFKFRELELKTSQQDYSNIKRAFNSLRGIDSDIIEESISGLQTDQIQSLVIPERAEKREDVLAAEQVAKLNAANANYTVEKNKPNLELYGSYATNGKNIDSGEAMTKASETDHSTTAVGIRFSSPLNLPAILDVMHGYQKDAQASSQIYQRKVFEQDQEWNELVSKFNDAKFRLQLSQKIAETQKEKLDHERNKLEKGRTVTYQVLSFEQDYAQSELLRIKNETDILNLYTQLIVFTPGGQK